MKQEIMKKATEAVSAFAERMALYTYMDNDCLTKMKRYVAEHSDVLDVVKEIVLGEHELYHILGLRPRQRKDAVELMAVYISAARKHDWAFFNKIIDIVNKAAKKGKRVGIEMDLLANLYEKTIHTGDVHLGYQAACNKDLNVVSRAFYPTVAICKKNILETEHAELILESALYFSESRRKIFDNNDWDGPFFRYLQANVTDKLLSGNLADIFSNDDMNVRRPEFLDLTVDSIGGYPYRDLTTSSLVNLCFGHSGILQSHILQSISFNRDKRLKMTRLTLEICMFLTNIDYFNEIAEKYSAGLQSHYPSKTRKIFESAVSEFTVVLRIATYLVSCLELYRKSILAVLEAEFFNPNLRQMSRQTQQLKQTTEEQKEKIAGLNLTIKGIRSENGTLSAQLAEVRNKNTGLQGKIDQQQAHIEELKNTIKELQAHNEQLEQDIADLLPASVEEASAGSVASNLAQTDCRQVLAPILAKYKVVFIGGYESTTMTKLAQRNPDAIIVPLNRVASADELIENADAILFKTDHLSHSSYLKVKGIAYKKRIPFDYLENGANVQRLEKNILEILTTMGFAAE